MNDDIIPEIAAVVRTYRHLHGAVCDRCGNRAPAPYGDRCECGASPDDGWSTASRGPARPPRGVKPADPNPRACPVCRTSNHPSEAYCTECGSALR